MVTSLWNQAGRAKRRSAQMKLKELCLCRKSPGAETGKKYFSFPQKLKLVVLPTMFCEVREIPAIFPCQPIKSVLLMVEVLKVKTYV